MNTKTQELVTAGYALAKGLDAESAKLVKELATELAVQRVRADELNKQVVSLAVENTGLKSNLMFWDAENPESPYSHPDEIANEYEMDYNTEFEVQVAARMPNRTYRVCSATEYTHETEMVHGVEITTPATDVAIAFIRAQGVDELADFAGKEYQRFVGDKPTQRKWKGIVLLCTDFAAQLRKDAGNE